MTSDAPDPEESEILPIAFEPTPGHDPGAERWRPDATQIAIGLGALIALIGVWFSLTAVSVVIRAEPETQRISFPGTWLELDFGDRTLLRSTTHEVRIEKDGYYPLEEEIEVTDAPDQTFRFELVKLPGLVSVTSTPVQGARVEVDGQEVGETPLVDTEIRPGRHRVVVSAARHLDSTLR